MIIDPELARAAGADVFEPTEEHMDSVVRFIEHAINDHVARAACGPKMPPWRVCLYMHKRDWDALCVHCMRVIAGVRSAGIQPTDYFQQRADFYGYGTRRGIKLERVSRSLTEGPTGMEYLGFPIVLDSHAEAPTIRYELGAVMKSGTAVVPFMIDPFSDPDTGLYERPFHVNDRPMEWWF